MSLILLDVFYAVLAFLLGAGLVSHLRLIAYRLPRREQFMRGHSYCECCHRPLAFWEVIPFLGWLLCNGKCYSCGFRIPFDHLILELSCGLIAASLFFIVAVKPL
jgi:prepilin signal peptidase PulO-like enzyme (type II secretory pathway)